jgi:hypothetical protein
MLELASLNAFAFDSRIQSSHGSAIFTIIARRRMLQREASQKDDERNTARCGDSTTQRWTSCPIQRTVGR